MVMRFEARFRCRDERWIDLDTIVTNLLDDPAVGGIVLNARDITDRKQAEHRVREAERRYRLMIEQMPAAAYITNDSDNNHLLYFSPQATDIFGYSPDELIARSVNWLDDIHPDDRERVWQEHLTTNATGTRYDVEYRFRTRERGYLWVRDIAEAIEGDNERTWHGIIIDISAQKQAEQNVRDLQLRYQSLVEQLPMAIYTLSGDAVQTPLYMSPQYERMFGFPIDEWRRNPAITRSRIHPDDLERVIAAVTAATTSGGPLELEYRILARDDRVVWVRDVATLVRDDEGTPRYWQGFILDISEQKVTEEFLLHQAFHDSLTGLPNRALLMDRVAHALARSQRSGATVALLFIDLDNFKVVNDSLGHDAGDQLLAIVAQRLATCVRPGDTVARLGGDEFTILLEDVDSADEAEAISQRVTEQSMTSVEIDGQEIQVTASIGIALSSPAASFASDLLRNADIAMYEAKRQGKARYITFTPAMVVRAHARLGMEIELRQALERDELSVFYQPILDLAANRVTAVEALVRWRHPERGVVLPEQFIALAEETGQIVALGEWVLRESCRQVVEWDMADATRGLTISVNLSPRQFLSSDFPGTVAAILHDTGLPPERLKLEITEGMLMDDSDGTMATFAALRDLGVAIAVDDFGTGYSSLAYLKRYPIDTLKIDRGFIRRLGENAEDAAIVDAVIAFARSLNLRVTAEGIETLQQLDYLRDRNCHEGQGYLFARPIPATALTDFLRVQMA
jgi:diguanylate cyclase (GGDEF)-like protein/PAS domain S-box-containing protein